MAEQRGGRRNALVIVVVLAAIVVVGTVALASRAGRAPDETDADEQTPQRGMEREAPTRQPVAPEQPDEPDETRERLIVLPADADAYVASEWPEESFGMDDLYLGYNLEEGFGAERIFLHFDVAGSIPPASVINEAGLRLRLRASSPPDDGPMGIRVRQIVSPWAELEISWGDRPRWGPARAEAVVGSVSRWYEWDVTALVGAWVSGEADNYGLMMMGDEAVQQRERIFYSRETPEEGATEQFYPQLIVDYSVLDDDEAPVSDVLPLPEYVRPGFGVAWTGEDRGAAGIASYDVEYRVDGGDWISWLEDVRFTSANFEGGEDGRRYAFRVRAEDRAGNVEPIGGAEAETTVDSEPPTSRVRRLPVRTNDASFNVSWEGHDHGSGIRYFDVRYRLNGGEWVPWQQRTVASDATFTTIVDGLYDFEVRAVDEVGLKEQFTGQLEASVFVDARAPFVGAE